MCMGGGGDSTPQQAPPPAPPPPPPRVLDQAAPETAVNDTSSNLRRQAAGTKKYRSDLAISNMFTPTDANKVWAQGGQGNTTPGLGIGM